MNNELRNTHDARRTTHDEYGFTLIELVVAIGLLTIVLVFSGAIFKTSIGSYRTASAQAEIMRKLRVITEQIDNDFKGLRKDAPMFVWVQQDPNDPNQRFDQIMFFADGDFQATQVPIVGNVARIYYGQARSTDPGDKNVKYPIYLQKRHRLLARRQHILTADPDIEHWPSLSDVPGTIGQAADPCNPLLLKNDIYEYDWVSLSQWQVVPAAGYDTTIFNICFDLPPYIDTGIPGTFHNIFCDGVGSFSVQWEYYHSLSSRYLWWPSIDPDSDGIANTINDFTTMLSSQFGIFFNVPEPRAATPRPDWFRPNGAKGPLVGSFTDTFFPSALKFTFTIFDSKGVFKQGQTFTHIVYLGE